MEALCTMHRSRFCETADYLQHRTRICWAAVGQVSQGTAQTTTSSRVRGLSRAQCLSARSTSVWFQGWRGIELHTAVARAEPEPGHGEQPAAAVCSQKTNPRIQYMQLYQLCY